jgi:hypothetical protein
MERLHELLEAVSTGSRLSRSDKEAVPELLDRMYPLLESGRSPPGFRLASGEVARGATGRIALNAYLLLLARKAFGRDYTRSDRRLHYWNMHLGFHIMRSHFGGWSEKGIYCCATCTLSVFPLYCTRAFGAFDCDLLKQNVLAALTDRTGPFSRKFSPRYAEWAMRFA